MTVTEGGEFDVTGIEEAVCGQVAEKVIEVDDKLTGPTTEPLRTPLMASAVWERAQLSFN